MENGDDDEVGDFLQRIGGGSSVHINDEKLYAELSVNTNESPPKCVVEKVPLRRRHSESSENHQSNKRAHSESKEKRGDIEHPLPYQSTTISFVGESPFQLSSTSAASNSWYRRWLERYLDAGYAPRNDKLCSEEAIANVFRTMPEELAAVIQEGVQALSILRASATASVPLPPALAAAQAATMASVSGEDEAWTRWEDQLWAAREDCG